MKVYVTKYALTSGIRFVEGKLCETTGLLSAKMPGAAYPSYFHKNGYAVTVGGALEQAKTMRDKKVRSLEAQISKLKAMTFSVPEVEL